MFFLTYLHLGAQHLWKSTTKQAHSQYQREVMDGLVRCCLRIKTQILKGDLGCCWGSHQISGSQFALLRFSTTEIPRTSLGVMIQGSQASSRASLHGRLVPL